MNIREKIGMRIKDIRTQKSLTQEAVAFKAEIDRTFMNHVENGKRNISVDTLEKVICNGLETNFRDFFDADVFNGKRRVRK
jgi:transcriptional regulator with XRE-family HTH domain